MKLFHNYIIFLNFALTDTYIQKIIYVYNSFFFKKKDFIQETQGTVAELQVGILAKVSASLFRLLQYSNLFRVKQANKYFKSSTKLNNIL